MKPKHFITKGLYNINMHFIASAFAKANKQLPYSQ